jgi:YVTN family beta-propeller protein
LNPVSWPANPCPPDPETCGQVAAGNGAVWVSRRTDNIVARVDPQTNTVTAMIPVGTEPDGIATSPGAVWVANHGAPSVSRIDPATNELVATISATFYASHRGAEPVTEIV